MRFTTKTEYGLVCLVYMARHPEEHVFTIKDIVKNESFSITYMEKILQKLRAANILKSHPGKHGGYTLARGASEITLKVVIEALEGSTFDVFCEPEVRENIVCTHFSLCGIRPVWAKTKEVLDNFFGSLTLEMIAKQEKDVRGMLIQKGA